MTPTSQQCPFFTGWARKQAAGALRPGQSTLRVDCLLKCLKGVPASMWRALSHPHRLLHLPFNHACHTPPLTLGNMGTRQRQHNE